MRETPTPVEDDNNVQTISVVEAWKYLEFLYWNYILNYLVNSLYSMHNTKRMTKEL